MENICIKDIILTKNQSRLEINVKNSEQMIKIFSIVKNFDIDIITQNQNLNNLDSKVFVSIDSKDFKLLVDQLHDVDIGSMTVSNLSKLSVTGIGIKTNISVLYGIIAKLNKSGIKILTISTSEVKISILIDEKDEKIALDILENLNF